MVEKNKIKISVVLTIVMFFLVLLVELVLIGNSNSINNRIFNDRINDDLSTIAKLNSEHAGILLRKQIEKVELIADGSLVESVLGGSESSEEDLERISEDLEELRNIYDDFDEIYVLSLEGKIVASADSDHVGRENVIDMDFLRKDRENSISEIYYSEMLKRNVVNIILNVFSDNRSSFNMSVSGTGAFDEVVPVGPNGEIGYVVAVLSLSELEKIVSSEGLGETGESYIINEDKFFITPSKFIKGENRGVLIQQVDGENSEACLNMKSKMKEGEMVFLNYLDYRGEEAVGTHALIPGTGWCLIVKIDISEVLEESRNEFLRSQLLVPIVVLVLVTLMVFVLGRVLDTRFKLS